MIDGNRPNRNRRCFNNSRTNGV
ncbi:hypothetical protein CY0110_19637 [Crocosphaera chwakensis CCY0110]|uniref:Uncharacterized protein n=1 Tax=Crocosphaera chwakensis CCY0110 TaxID=391612 RepID=A3IJQ9_9CHRO|nr:hypothetical protein CY0110_19637 [Crocosphaera chwakensis CCY0110]